MMARLWEGGFNIVFVHTLSSESSIVSYYFLLALTSVKDTSEASL